MSHNCINLKTTGFVINLNLDDQKQIFSFLDATLRGGFGYTLKSMVCIAEKVQCSECILKHKCVYAFIFETPPPKESSRLKSYKAIPHPFTMRTVQKENSVNLFLTLFGNAVDYMPYFLHTFKRLGEKGIGINKTTFTIDDVVHKNRSIHSEGTNEIDTVKPDLLTVFPDKNSCGEITLRFLSPLTLRKNGMQLRTFDTRTFFYTLLRRITNLNAFYGDQTDSDIDPRAFLGQIDELNTDARMKYVNLSRYSTRQKRRLNYGGITGDVTFSGNIGILRRLIEAGAITGVGKNTAFGCGVYEILSPVGDDEKRKRSAQTQEEWLYENGCANESPVKQYSES